MSEPDQPCLLPPRPHMERAVALGDAAYDGAFVYGVRTTGVFCRPGCAPPRRARPAHCEYFPGIRAALAAGYRPCRRCRPEIPPGTPPLWVDALIPLLDADPERRPDAATLASLGVGIESARRWFLRVHGMSLAEWARRRRLAIAFAALDAGAGLDEAAFASGFESLSGFRDAWSRVTGGPPGSGRPVDWIRTALVPTPLGTIRTCATGGAVIGLEFADRTPATPGPTHPATRTDLPRLPGPSPLLDRLAAWIADYFDGTRVEPPDIPVAPHGTPFQQRVWDLLRSIPAGTAWSYALLAERLGQATATRAVARANATNPVCLLIPCHRVIGSDGDLGGYGGGLWRKRLLLELERTGRFQDRLLG